jgi:hypothetical protein
MVQAIEVRSSDVSEIECHLDPYNIICILGENNQPKKNIFLKVLNIYKYVHTHTRQFFEG